MDKDFDYTYEAEPSTDDWEDEEPEKEYEEGEHMVADKPAPRKGRLFFAVFPVILLLILMAAVITMLLWNHFHGNLLELI